MMLLALFADHCSRSVAMSIAVSSLIRIVRIVVDRLSTIQLCLVHCLVVDLQSTAALASFDYDSFEFAELPVALPLDKEQRLKNEIVHKINSVAFEIECFRL